VAVAVVVQAIKSACSSCVMPLVMLTFSSYALQRSLRCIIVFRGINSISMDAKGRMALPARYRETVMVASAGRLVVTIDMRESCLLVYPLSEWEIVQAKLEGLSNMNAQARLLQRLLIGHATDLELDSAGRLLLPTMLREYAGLQKKLVLVGQGNKIEVWSADHWQQRLDDWLQAGVAAMNDNAEFFQDLSL
jgi:MraZ protein